MLKATGRTLLMAAGIAMLGSGAASAEGSFGISHFVIPSAGAAMNGAHRVSTSFGVSVTVVDEGNIQTPGQPKPSAPEAGLSYQTNALKRESDSELN